ncbi:MAG TPA: glycosyltransferase [Candidatus Binataceae bacterium]|nr:glycosyltransferase [Candidatus Binataceae bacterium]
MHALAFIARTFASTSLVYYLFATITAIRFARLARRPPPALPSDIPRVAVLKPLRGRNQSLPTNLNSHLETDYPSCKFYFAVESTDDPAAEVSVSLQKRHPSVPVKILTRNHPECENRKVGKLIEMADLAADADIFVISDADIAVSREHLRHIVGELMSDPKIGIVTCTYSARPIGTFGSRLEALAVNTDFTPQVMLASAIEPLHYAFGATIAIKRAALEAMGGFARVKDLLADDFYIGKFVREAGYEVRLSTSIVTTVCEERTFMDFWRHQLRWARTYRTTRPSSLATIFLHGPFWGLLFAILTRFSLVGVMTLGAVLAVRIASAAFIMRSVFGLQGEGRDALLTPIKDLAMTGIWFASLLSNEIEWGGRRLEILPGGAMREVNG